MFICLPFVGIVIGLKYFEQFMVVSMGEDKIMFWLSVNCVFIEFGLMFHMMRSYSPLFVELHYIGLAMIAIKLVFLTIFSAFVIIPYGFSPPVFLIIMTAIRIVMLFFSYIITLQHMPKISPIDRIKTAVYGAFYVESINQSMLWSYYGTLYLNGILFSDIKLPLVAGAIRSVMFLLARFLKKTLSIHVNQEWEMYCDQNIPKPQEKKDASLTELHNEATQKRVNTIRGRGGIVSKSFDNDSEFFASLVLMNSFLGMAGWFVFVRTPNYSDYAVGVIFSILFDLAFRCVKFYQKQRYITMLKKVCDAYIAELQSSSGIISDGNKSGKDLTAGQKKKNSTLPRHNLSVKEFGELGATLKRSKKSIASSIKTDDDAFTSLSDEAVPVNPEINVASKHDSPNQSGPLDLRVIYEENKTNSPKPDSKDAIDSNCRNSDDSNRLSSSLRGGHLSFAQRRIRRQSIILATEQIGILKKKLNLHFVNSNHIPELSSHKTVNYYKKIFNRQIQHARNRFAIDLRYDMVSSVVSVTASSALLAIIISPQTEFNECAGFAQITSTEAVLRASIVIFSHFIIDSIVLMGFNHFSKIPISFATQFPTPKYSGYAATLCMMLEAVTWIMLFERNLFSHNPYDCDID